MEEEAAAGTEEQQQPQQQQPQQRETVTKEKSKKSKKKQREESGHAKAAKEEEEKPAKSAAAVAPRQKQASTLASSASSSTSAAGTASLSALSTASRARARPRPPPRAQGPRLWADKYAPQHVGEVVGNNSNVQNIVRWLRQWHAVHVRKQFKPPGGRENPGARAVLISGPPGIGKTTTAHLVAKMAGMDVFELNASDTRSQKILKQMLTDASVSRAIVQQPVSAQSSSASSAAAPAATGGAPGIGNRVVIMDEVDGMSSSDRGGIAELIRIIKVSKVPIICICNDRQAQKIRSLANHCYDLRFQRPQKGTIATRVVEIARREGLTVERSAAETLVESVGNDIRQVLNTLQMWAQQQGGSGGKRMDSATLQQRLSSIRKDDILRVSPFDAVRTLLMGPGFDPAHPVSLDLRMNSWFTDYNLTPLLTQQNYVAAVSQSNRALKCDDGAAADRLAAAAEALSDSELVGSMVRGRDNHWELLTTHAAMDVRVGNLSRGGAGFPSFPEWLGKYSMGARKKRLTGELAGHMNVHIACNSGSVRLNYVPVLRARLAREFVSLDRVEDKEAKAARLDQLVAMLDEYGLSREDFVEALNELRVGAVVPEEDITKIQATTKAAFTRAYNKVAHRSQALAHEQEMPKKKRGAAVAAAAAAAVVNARAEDDNNDDNDDAARAEEDENSDDDLSAFQAKPKGKRKKAAAGGAKAGAPRKRARKKK